MEVIDEVEQHVTINGAGRVWFSAYVFGKHRDGRYEGSRTTDIIKIVILIFFGLSDKLKQAIIT